MKKSNYPTHVAIIMDGNGRWAKSRMMPRVMGHKRGVEATKSIVRHAGEIGLNYLTLYAFSTENWTRPQNEIDELMGMLRIYMKSEAAELHKNNVRLRVIGFRERLAQDIIEMIDNLENMTKDNTGLNLTVALDYGGRQEIVNAAQQLVRENIDITEENLSAKLFTSDLPDPDLLIRTSGEMRVSNFLLWQCAYSEFIFTETLWPDFTPEKFDACLAEFQTRDRRFGGLTEEVNKA
jgi:undecaprenyl diphosphate synthase